MGFLIFAFRKLTLKRQISQHQYQQMMLSSEQQQVQHQISIMKQAKGMMEDSWSMVYNSINSTSNSIFQAQVNGYNAPVTQATKEYTDAVASKDQARINTAESQMKSVKENADSQYKTAFALFQAGQQTNVVLNQAVEQMFAGCDQAQLNILSAKDKRIEQEMASLDSQLKIESAELDSVEKAENDAAKKSAPSFGLS